MAPYTGTYRIAIAKYGNPAIVNFNLFTYANDLEYKTLPSSYIQPADASGAMAVGAFDYRTPTLIESFSSQVR